jgi:6-pyruvoyltetrahydropterin/6-carboxytetrahydropterin synthase
MFVLHLAKEPFKFSCSHFTILAPDRAERLHGHNYQVRVDIEVNDIDPELGFAFDFNAVKPLIRGFCIELDERILLPAKSPFLKITNSAGEVEVRFNGKRYVFPSQDTLPLPLSNITAEELARYTCERLIEGMAGFTKWTGLSVRIEETRGQSASYRFKR